MGGVVVLEQISNREYREPICPFCYAFADVKVPMTFDPRTGVWQCIRGNHTAANLEDEDEETLREDLIEMLDSPQDRFNREKYMMALTGPPKKRSGGNKRGRKSKTKQKPVPWYNTVDRASTE